MKIKYLLFLIAISAFATSCFSDKQAGESVNCLDFSKNYPEKELYLTDFADVTYLYLNSDDDKYLYSGTIYDITDNTVIIVDYNSGNILFFSKDGFPKSHFNRKGNGPEEYVDISKVIYDEAADDLFVVDRFSKKGIMVYSSAGKYKRTIPVPQGTMIQSQIVSFDDNALLYYDEKIDAARGVAIYENKSIDDYFKAPYYFISKSDGTVLDSLIMPLAPQHLVVNIEGRRIPGFPSTKNRLIKNKNDVYLCNPENDTVFVINKNKSLIPVIHKIPLVGSTDPKTHFNNCIDAGRYQFTELYTLRPGDPEVGIARFPVKHYMHDKITGEIFRQKLLSQDYNTKIFIISPSNFRNIFEKGYYFELDLFELKQANLENKLSGKLKELVDTLNENEDNNVFMLLNFN